MRLSALAVRNAKSREKPYKLGDGGGLCLLVKPSGTRLWRMNYAYIGRQNTLSFGEWPLIGLTEAREKRGEAKRYLVAGLDPSEERKLEWSRCAPNLPRATRSVPSPRSVPQELVRRTVAGHARKEPLASRQGLRDASKSADQPDRGAGGASGAPPY